MTMVNPPEPTTAAGLRCWAEIGVWGDNTCAELKQHVHCRNCPVYAEAGRSLLAREIPAGYLDSWTGALRELDQDDRAGREAVMIFRLGDEWLALPVKAIREITEKRPVHRIPHRSDSVLLGLASLRGELHLAVSLMALLEIETVEPTPAAANARGRMLFFEHQRQGFLFPVDTVEGIHFMDTEKLAETPVTLRKAIAGHTRGLFKADEQTVGLLNPESILHTLERHHL